MSYLAFGVGDNSPCSFTSFLSPAQVSFSLICVGDSMGGGGGKNEGKGGGGGLIPVTHLDVFWAYSFPEVKDWII